MNPLLTLIKEQEASPRNPLHLNQACMEECDLNHKTTLITLLEANCERLRGEMKVRVVDRYNPYTEGKLDLIDEEIALYGELISELKAN